MASQLLQSTSADQPQSLKKALTVDDDLTDLQNVLHEVDPIWFNFGLQLKVKYSTLCKIKKSYRDVEDQFREVLVHRLSQLPPLTWHDILQALRSDAVQMDQLASEIESQYLSQPSVSTSSLVSCTHTPTAPSPSTASQSTLQSNPSTPNAQPHPPPQPAPQKVYVHVDNTPSQSPQLLLTQSHHPQHSSCPPPPDPLTPTPIQPPVEETQTPGSSQPFSRQLMSLPVTSQVMPGPSPQLSQDVATPHHLQVGEQQALQGQPPLQHIPSRELQTVAQSHGTDPGSGPPQAMGVCYKSPVAYYIDYIKTIYQRSVIEKRFVSIKWPPTPPTVYINLVCVDRTADLPKEEADECTRTMVCDGSVDVILKKKTSIDFSDIARNVPDSKSLILVEGAPGVGKSTFSWEFCQRWEKGEIAQQYQLVLLLRLRDKRVSKAKSLADLIYHSSPHICQAVVQELETTLGVNTLIILEGLDELPKTCRTQFSVFFQLINGKLLSNATVLVTSRPWATERIHKKCRDRIFQHIEILGFTSDQIEEYVTSVFMGKKTPAAEKDKENIKDVMSYIGRYPQIRACMYIPLNSAIVVSVYQESKAGEYILPKNLTQLYYALIQTLLLRYLYEHPEYGKRKWKIKSLKDLPQDVYCKLLAISKLAYSGICADQGDSVKLIFSDLPPDFETLGLMQSASQLFVTQGEDMSHNFLHLTVQEFLAALHISTMPPEKQLEHFQRQRNREGGEWLPEYCLRQEEGRWRVVLKFLAGITKLANFSPDLLRGLFLRKPRKGVTMVAHTPPGSPSNEAQINCRDRYNILDDVEVTIQQAHWMFEAQRHDIVSLVLQEKTVEFKCHEVLTPLDYFSLGYCIVHSYSQWVLTVERSIIRKAVLGEDEVRMLVAGASTRYDTTAKLVGLGGSHMGMGIHERRLVGMDHHECGDNEPPFITAEALNVLFLKLKNMIHLKELHLNLPAQCSSIAWPNLSGLRVLHLAISGTKNLKLHTLLSQLSLESLMIEVTGYISGFGLDSAASIGILLSSNCPQNVYITDKHSPITAEVAIDQYVQKQLNNATSVVKEKESLEPCIICRLDWYSLGCVIAHSNCQWVVTVEESRGHNVFPMLLAVKRARRESNVIMGEVIEEDKVRMLVAGASTRPDTAAKVVGLRGPHMGMDLHERRLVSMECHKSDGYLPLSISAEALNVLFVKLKNMIHLQELHLNLPAQCSSISWRNLSRLRVLHLAISGTKKWKLDSLLHHLSLDSLTIEVTSGGGGLGFDNAASIGLFLSSNCPKHTYITDKHSPNTVEFTVGEHVHEKQFDNTTSVVQEKESRGCIRCRLDWYSLGCVIAYSNCQWMLTVEKARGYNFFPEKEVNVLVVGANARLDTTARVVGMRGGRRGRDDGSGYYPLSMSAQALNLMFTSLQDVLHLQELYLKLPVECSSITWPNLSGLRVLHLEMNGERNWRMDTLLPHLSLESLTIKPASYGATVVREDCVAIGMLLSSSDCFKCLHFQWVPKIVLHVDDEGMKSITKAISENALLPLKSLKVECECTFSDTAAHSLALFITNSITLHHLSIVECTFSAHGLLELAQAMHHSSSLQERKLEDLTCTVNGDDEARDFAQLLVDSLHWKLGVEPLQFSHICDKGAQSIATALHHNSTLERLDLSNNSIGDTGSIALAQALHHNSTLRVLQLSNNSVSDAGSAALAQALHYNSTLEGLYLSYNSISDAGSAALAQALHHNSTLWWLNLSGIDTISAESIHQLLQAMTVNTSIRIVVLPRRCEEFATQCPHYRAVKDRIEFR